MTTSSIALFVVALLVPLVMALVWGRRLVTAHEDPGGPERWLAYSSAMGKVGLFCACVVVMVGRGYALSGLFLIVAASAVGSFPARRKIFGETWDLRCYLEHVLRFPVAMSGFWIVVAAAPATIAGFPGIEVPLGVVLAVGLLVWTLGFFRFLPGLMRARSVDSPATAARFEQLVARSEILSRGRRPVLLQAGPRGGVWANTFAVSGRRRPALIVADLLVEKLDPDELGALQAQGLAALEFFRKSGEVGRAFRTLLLIAGAVACVPLAAALDQALVPWVGFFWFVLVLVVFARKGAGEQRNVSQWDRRAVELCGDPEALVRALSKVHALSNMPGRWDQEFEKSASHPSLAARIQAIRQAAGFGARTLEEEVVLESKEAGRCAILGPDQVWFLEGVAAGEADAPSLRQRAGSSRAYAYRSLAGLYLKVGIGGQAVLQAVTAEGQDVRLPLAASGVKRAQSALDSVFGKLAPRVVGRTQLQGLAVLAALLLALAALSPAVPALLLLLVLQLLRRREVAPMLGAGAVAIAAGSLALARLASTCGCELTAAAGTALTLAAGAILLVAGFRLARLSPQTIWTGYRDTVAMFSLGALIAQPLAVNEAIGSGHALDAAQTAGPLFVFGLAVVVLARYRAHGWARALALGLVLATLVPAVLGSDSLRLGSDRRYFPGPGLEPRWVEAPPPMRSLAVSSDLQGIQLSPSGRRFLGAQFAEHRYDDEAQSGQTFLVEDRTGQTQPVNAVALAFIDDQRVLALKRADRGLVVEEMGSDLASGSWQAQIPALTSVRLVADGKRFRVIGRKRLHWVAVDGEIGRSEVRIREAAGSGRASTYQAGWIPSGDGESALSVVIDYRASGLPFWIARSRQRTMLNLASPDVPARTLLRTTADISCPDVPLDRGDFICVASERDRGWIWSIPAGSDQVHAGIRMPGRALDTLRSGDSLAVRLAEGAVFFGPHQLSSVRFPRQQGHLVAISEHAFALLGDSEGAAPAILTIYNR